MDLVGKVDAGIRVVILASVRNDSARHAMHIAIKRNLVILINKLASPRVLPKRDEDILIAVLVMLSELDLERLGRFPCIVVRDLGGDVVRDVRLCDAVEEVRTDRP